jgi:hypothetical protein
MTGVAARNEARLDVPYSTGFDKNFFRRSRAFDAQSLRHAAGLVTRAETGLSACAGSHAQFEGIRTVLAVQRDRDSGMAERQDSRSGDFARPET